MGAPPPSFRQPDNPRPAAPAAEGGRDRVRGLSIAAVFDRRSKLGSDSSDARATRLAVVRRAPRPRRVVHTRRPINSPCGPRARSAAAARIDGAAHPQAAAHTPRGDAAVALGRLSRERSSRGREKVELEIEQLAARRGERDAGARASSSPRGRRASMARAAGPPTRLWNKLGCGSKPPRRAGASRASSRATSRALATPLLHPRTQIDNPRARRSRPRHICHRNMTPRCRQKLKVDHAPPAAASSLLLAVAPASIRAAIGRLASRSSHHARSRESGLPQYTAARRSQGTLHRGLRTRRGWRGASPCSRSPGKQKQRTRRRRRRRRRPQTSQSTCRPRRPPIPTRI